MRVGRHHPAVRVDRHQPALARRSVAPQVLGRRYLDERDPFRLSAGPVGAEAQRGLAGPWGGTDLEVEAFRAGRLDHHVPDTAPGPVNGGQWLAVVAPVAGTTAENIAQIKRGEVLGRRHARGSWALQRRDLGPRAGEGGAPAD